MIRGNRRWVNVLLVIAAIGAVIAVSGIAVVFPYWKTEVKKGGQTEAEPFRIAGNFYYVGASDSTSFLLTSPEGHILIDGGYSGTPPLIMASIAKLGFNIRDVKVLLNSHAHGDHAGGLAELQRASGAALWISNEDAEEVAAGGPTTWPMKLLSTVGVMRYEPPRIDRKFSDGAAIRVGSTVVTAHITPGHTRGCTSFTFPVREGNRELNVVHACSLDAPELFRYKGVSEDFERTLRVLRSLPADIWVTSHARAWGRYKKFAARETAKNPVDPFIDPEGYRAYIDSAEAQLRRDGVLSSKK